MQMRIHAYLCLVRCAHVGLHNGRQECVRVGTQRYMIYEDACGAYVISALPSGLETTR